MSKRAMIDNRYHVETAEGIDIAIMPASIAVRSYAFVIDFFIRLIIVAIAGMVFAMMADFGVGLFFITLFVVEWFYPVIYEVSRGATPGKSAFKLRVVYDNGLPISFAGSLTRNLFRFIDLLPFCYAAGALSMILNKQNKRLGDIVAGTVVVYKNDKLPSAHFNFEKDAIGNLALSTEQQQLILSFAQRSKYLSEARQIELASSLNEVLGLEGMEAVQRLKSIAAAIEGRT